MYYLYLVYNGGRLEEIISASYIAPAIVAYNTAYFMIQSGMVKVNRPKLESLILMDSAGDGKTVLEGKFNNL